MSAPQPTSCEKSACESSACAPSACSASAGDETTPAKPLLLNLSQEAKDQIARNVERLRASDQQLIGKLQNEVTRLTSEVAQLLNEKREAKQKRLARSAAPDVRTLHTPPPVVLERHGVENEVPEEVCCQICAQRRERHIHLFLRYGRVGFQYQSLGKDPQGNHRATWAVVTHRVCDMAHETTIAEDGSVNCVELI